MPKKKAKKLKKINKKHHYGIISSQNCLENAKKVRNKNYSFVPSLPDAKFKIPKKFKKIKNAIMASFEATIG